MAFLPLTPDFFENVLTFFGSREEREPLNLLKNAPNGKAVVAIVVVLGIHCGRIDVQIVHIVSIVDSRRPEVAVRALIVGRAAVEVARERGT